MANINERAELHKTIWKIANDLRGSVDDQQKFPKKIGRNRLKFPKKIGKKKPKFPKKIGKTFGSSSRKV